MSSAACGQSERYAACDDEPKKKDFGKERKNAWVGSNLVLAEGRDTKYYTSCFHIRKRCAVWYLRLVLLRNETDHAALSECRTPRHRS